MLSATVTPSGVLITNTTDPADPSPQSISVDHVTNPGSARIERTDGIGPILVLTDARFLAIAEHLADAVDVEEGDPADWAGWTSREYDAQDNYYTSYIEPSPSGSLGDGEFVIAGLTSSNTWGSLTLEIGTAKGLLDYISTLS